MEPDLFSEAGRVAEMAQAPLAVRLRPRTLEEVVGQRHLLLPGSPLRRLAEADSPLSVVLWGPPGTGKTTLASVISRATRRHFVELSAVTAGVKDLRAVVDEARRRLAMSGAQTVLFIDEVHRFSKTQQDALLPSVEQRWVSLVAATTENPFFSLTAPLLSRSLLLTLEPLDDDDIAQLLDRALTDERGYAGTLALAADARAHLVRLAGGDARRALTALEAAGESARSRGRSEVDLSTLELAVDRAAVRYDRDGDQHYDVVSAFIKSVRGSDADAALHYLARMLEAGEDPRFVARRLIILASEDVGLADPTGLPVAVAAAEALDRVGLPEARLALAQATLHLALAPKSNAVIAAYDEAVADVRAGRAGPVPAHLRDKHYPGAGRLGHGEGYRYPHDDPAGVLAQQYPPDALAARAYYRPSPHGAEAEAGRRHAALRRAIRGEQLPDPAPGYRPPCTPAPVPPAKVTGTNLSVPSATVEPPGGQPFGTPQSATAGK